MIGWIVKPKNWTGVFFGPYSTEYGADAARRRLLRFSLYDKKIYNRESTGKTSTQTFRPEDLEVVYK